MSVSFLRHSHFGWCFQGKPKGEMKPHKSPAKRHPPIQVSSTLPLGFLFLPTPHSFHCHWQRRILGWICHLYSLGNMFNHPPSQPNTQPPCFVTHRQPSPSLKCCKCQPTTKPNLCKFQPQPTPHPWIFLRRPLRGRRFRAAERLGRSRGARTRRAGGGAWPWLSSATVGRSRWGRW